jgi:hypothetical protein
MLTRIMDSTDFQARMIRDALRHKGPITPSVYMRAAQVVLMGQPGAPRQHEVTTPFEMRIAGGRWVQDCLECPAGVMTGRGWPIAVCFRCGATYRNVVWPKEIDTIERLVLMRPMSHQHWRPDETVERVREINRENGIVENGD